MLAEHDRPWFCILGFPTWWRIPGHGHDLDLRYALGKGQRRLHRLGQAALDALSQHKPINNNRDAVLFVPCKVNLVSELVEFTVDNRSAEPLGGKIGQQGVVGSLATLHNRCEDLKPGALVQLKDPVDYLLGCLPHEPLTGLGVVGNPDSCVQETQVVVDLGNRPDR